MMSFVQRLLRYRRYRQSSGITSPNRVFLGFSEKKKAAATGATAFIVVLIVVRHYITASQHHRIARRRQRSKADST